MEFKLERINELGTLKNHPREANEFMPFIEYTRRDSLCSLRSSCDVFLCLMMACAEVSESAKDHPMECAPRHM